MESASKRSMVSAAQTGGVLPPDLAWEILLRVPASSLCSFRAVCRSWRSLLSDPSFAKAHAALRPGVILTLAGAEDRIDVVDYSGHIVRQISIPPAEEEGVPPPPLPAHPGPFYLFRARKRTRVLDPDTGAVAALPFDDIDVPSREGTSWYAPDREPCYTLWGGLSTGHPKVLRVATRTGNARREQLCDVLTLGVGDDQRRRWRRRPSPPICIESELGAQGVTVQGLAYFMPDESFPGFIMDASRDGCRRAMELMNSVASFNLETEEWSPSTLRGPSAIDTGTGKCRLKLAKLSNTLVMVHFDRTLETVDLWFATDLKRSLWVKKHSVPRELLLPHQQMSIHRGTKLLMALDGERIVFSCLAEAWTPEGPRWVTRIYDSRTKACTHVSHQLGVRAIVGVYRGSFSMLGECNARFASQPTEAPSLREGRTSIL